MRKNILKKDHFQAKTTDTSIYTESLKINEQTLHAEWVGPAAGAVVKHGWPIVKGIGTGAGKLLKFGFGKGPLRKTRIATTAVGTDVATDGVLSDFAKQQGTTGLNKFIDYVKNKMPGVSKDDDWKNIARKYAIPVSIASIIVADYMATKKANEKEED